MKTFLSITILAIVALLTLGFVYPNKSPVFDYQTLLAGFYAMVAFGLVAVGIIDVFSDTKRIA